MPYRFAAEIPDELAEELQELVAEVRAAERPSRHAGDGADLILRLTEACLDDYFLRSVRQLGLGMMSESAVRLGLRTASGGIALFVRRLAGGMSDEQVLKLADLLEAKLFEAPGGGSMES